MSRFVAAAVRVARDYDADISVGCGGREADAKRLLESLDVLGKPRIGDEVLLRAEGEDADEALSGGPGQTGGEKIG